MSKKEREKIVERVTTDLHRGLLEWNESSSSESRVLFNEPLTKRSSLRIGGLASFWIEVGSRKDLVDLMALLGDAPFSCVGLGSNSLFPDAGIHFPLLRFVGELATWQVQADGSEVVVQAGAVNAHLVRGLLKENLVGAEFLALIPGTFGGAVALNAGTREKDLASILAAVDVLRFDDLKKCYLFEELEAAQIELEYRKAKLPPKSVVLGGRIHVESGDAVEAKRRVKADKDSRNQTQPYRLASAGSTFANPPGDYAGRLIEAVGLKGVAVGGARVSELHANFFINEENASAEDFLGLMALARYRVRESFGIELRPEVKFVGVDGFARMRDLEEEWKSKDV